MKMQFLLRNDLAILCNFCTNMQTRHAQMPQNGECKVMHNWTWYQIHFLGRKNLNYIHTNITDVHYAALILGTVGLVV